MNADDRTIEKGSCPRDGLALATHPRCATCHILIGPNHYAARAIHRGERTLCEDCAKREDERQ